MIPIEDVRSKYGVEIAVVLLCCRVYFNTEKQETLQQFINHNNINWKGVISLSGYHRIEPVVYQVLGTFKITQDVDNKIKQNRLLLIQRNFIQGLETERIISLLNDNGIKCTPYKGVSFSKQMYGDIISRESSDIDLIIKYADFERVLPLMKSDGFSFENQPEYSYYKKEIFKIKKGLNFNKYSNGYREFHIEFHWRISDNMLQIPKKAHALLYNTNGKQLLVKNNCEMLDDNAHYLAIFIHHAINDSLRVLRNIIDLSQIDKAYNNGLNSHYIRETISNLNLQKAAAVCNYLSGSLLGIELPFISNSATYLTPSLKNRFADQLLKHQMLNSIKPQFYNKNVLLLKETLSDKFNYLLACLRMRFQPSPKDMRIFKLPRKLSFLYVILKPFRSMFSRVSDAEEKKIAEQQ